MWVRLLESNQDLLTRPGCCSKRGRDTIVSKLVWETKDGQEKKPSMPTLGNNGRRSKRQRSSRASSAAIVENNGDWSKSRQYKLKWLKDTKAFKCFGCKSAVSIPGEIPESPNDVIVSTNEYRSFMNWRMGSCKFASGQHVITSFPNVSWQKMRISFHRPI